MMSNFTYAYWPSVCLLWIKVSLDLLHIFHLDFLSFFVIELYDLFVCFGNWTLIGHIICRYFLPVCRLSFHFVYGFLCCAKASICLFLLLILLPWEIDLRKQWSHLLIFAFNSVALGDWLKKTVVRFMSEDVLPMFSSRSFMVSCLIFRSFSHFEFIFVYGVRVCSNIIDLYAAVQLVQQHLLKRLSFPNCIFLPPVSKINWP